MQTAGFECSAAGYREPYVARTYQSHPGTRHGVDAFGRKRRLMRTKLIDYFLTKRGLAIGPLNGPTMSAALRRLSARQIPLESIIDVGASNGCWTEEFLPFYPEARYLCVEAQPVHN